MLQKQEAEKPKGPAIHPLDLHYDMLNTNMEPLDKSGKEYKIIEKYAIDGSIVWSSHRLLIMFVCLFVGRFITNTNGGSKFSINTVLKIARPDEESHKTVLGSLDNHKSDAKMCYLYGGAQAVLLLADVALGTPYKIPSGEFLDYSMVKDQHGCDSTHGLGRVAPTEDEFETLPDGVVVPAGTLKAVPGDQYLLYNEFIVYRREQVQLRYLVSLDFHNVACACNNKFYMVQLIQDGSSYMVFRKWGRVGAKNPRRYNSSLEKAQASFTKKFLDKSGNEWPLTGPFERVEGKYVLVGGYSFGVGRDYWKTDYGGIPELDDEVPDEEDEATSDGEQEEEVPSVLHETVQDVLKVSLVLVLQSKLSKAQISQGYALLQQLSAALQEIEELKKVVLIKAEEPPKRTGTRQSTRVKRTANPNAAQIRRLKNGLKTLSSDFYTLIPHDFGRNLPPPIDSMDEVKLKIDLLEVLANIEISQKLQAEKKKNAKKKLDADRPKLNSLDAQYNLLNVKMESLPESTEEYKVIER
ncbi:unnamed protein product [Phytophthora fragariaefolia]|uniref:Poly [ADP-ribose] polymerase n=1 Tax=Phytophthora fragariaefolia TaxID=1490495 RepID=A0A9W6Y8W4_9STRA|nr:unnamed protein product [Phytophthora fragariaefolia]